MRHIHHAVNIDTHHAVDIHTHQTVNIHTHHGVDTHVHCMYAFTPPSNDIPIQKITTTIIFLLLP